jgi:hypothetical protein
LAELPQDYETLIDKARSEPVTITRDGRDRLVMALADVGATLVVAPSGEPPQRRGADEGRPYG